MNRSTGLTFFPIAAVAVGALTTLALVLSLGAGSASAKKPPKDPPPPGVVYYTGSGDLHVMRADGSEKTLVAPDFFNGAQNYTAEASFHLHGGMRWFLHVRPMDSGAYPDGEPRVEVFAVSETGATVQLSDDPTVQCNRPMWSDIQWARDDTVVSWLARRWGTDGQGQPVVVELGIYYVELLDDVSAEPPPVAPSRVPTDGYPSHEVQGWIGPWPDDSGFGWFPNGTAVAFGSHDPASPGLFVADVATGVITQLTDTPAVNPRWSPDGGRIAVWSSAGVSVLFADGSGETLIAANTSTNVYYHYNRWPQWSPDSTHLVFQKLSSHRKKNALIEDIYRIPAAGGDEVCLTADTRGWAHPAGWRDAE